MVNKRGDQSIWITISIIIGVVLLALLIFGFMNTWDMFQGQVDVVADSNSNIDKLITACSLRCSSKATYAYCVEVREIEVNGKAVINGSCYGFAEYGSSYKFEKCSRLTCENENKKVYDIVKTEIINEIKDFSGVLK